jgi:hypothetical protein
MGSQNFTSAIDFRLLQAADRRDEHGRFLLARESGPPAVLLELLGAPFDAVNTDLSGVPSGPALSSALRPLLDVPRMSTMAIGAVLNRAVAAMPPGHAFVNAGVWHGYTLLAAMARNPDAVCVGIDDFSEFGGPRDEFGERFEAARSPRHTFHEMDYRDYMAEVHEGPIGVYLYDGENSYEGEMEALQAGERFFADGCLLVADDTNRSQRRQAMLDFAEQSPDDYSLVLDVSTAGNRHPTFWNGTLVLRRNGAGDAEPARVIGREPHDPPELENGPMGAGSVAVVLLAESAGDDLARAAGAIEAQTWGDLELIVADCAGRPPGATLRQALDRSRSEFVAFADCAADLRPDAVELSLAYPAAARFWQGRPDAAQWARLEAGLAAGADVDSVLGSGTEFTLVSDPLGLPQTLQAGPAAPLAPAPLHLHELDEDAAIQAIETARADGRAHLVVLSNRFQWLERRPRVAAHLAAQATTPLANEHVRLFAFDGAA